MPSLVERSGTLFPTAVVCSLPRPDYVREIVVDGWREPCWEGRLDAGVAFAVSVQEAADLDVISDGEWRRASYIGIIAEMSRRIRRMNEKLSTAELEASIQHFFH